MPGDALKCGQLLKYYINPLTGVFFAELSFEGILKEIRNLVGKKKFESFFNRVPCPPRTVYKMDKKHKILCEEFFPRKVRRTREIFEIEDGKGINADTREVELMKPLDCANYFIYLDQLDDPADSQKVDLLKLQKLLYYAYCFGVVQVGIKLWDPEKHSMIKSYRGPFMREIHNYYSDYNICNDWQKMWDLEKVALIILEIIWSMYRYDEGKVLECMTHQEIPHKKLSMYQELQEEHIVEEFSKSHQSKRFWMEYLKLPSNKRIFDKKLYMFIQNELDEDLYTFCSELGDTDPEINELLGLCLFPQALLEQSDPVDVLYSRPSVLHRVALSARFGFVPAKNELVKIFQHHCVFEDTDPYTIVYKRLLTVFNMEYVEIQKIPFDTKYVDWRNVVVVRDLLFPLPSHDENKQKEILVELCKNGICCALEQLMAKQYCSEEEFINLMEEFGQSFDVRGYYLMGKKYASEGRHDIAVKYFKKSLPFYGFSELVNAKKICNPINVQLDGFFADLLKRFLGGASTNLIEDTEFARDFDEGAI